MIKFVSRLKKVYAILTGESTKEMLQDVSASTSDVCRRVDELLNRAQLDGEDEWFKRKEKERNDRGGTTMHCSPCIRSSER